MDAQMPHNVDQVRAAIDNIDAQLITLLAERQSFVARSGELMEGQGGQAGQTAQRVADVITARRTQASGAGLDPDVAERIWQEIMAAFSDYERGIAQGTDTALGHS